MISDVVPAKADTKMLNEIDRPPYRISVGNSAGSVDGQVDEKQDQQQAPSPRARGRPAAPSPLLSTQIIGKARTTSPIEPAQHQRLAADLVGQVAEQRDDEHGHPEHDDLRIHCDVVVSIAVPPPSVTLSSRNVGM